MLFFFVFSHVFILNLCCLCSLSVFSVLLLLFFAEFFERLGKRLGSPGRGMPSGAAVGLPLAVVFPVAVLPKVL